MKLHLKKDSCLQTDAFAAGKYLTITGFRHYYGLQPFRIGSLIRCRKEPDNAYDDEDIFTMNASLAWNQENHTIRAACNNIFDKEYYLNNSGYIVPERRFIVSYEYKF